MRRPAVVTVLLAAGVLAGTLIGVFGGGETDAAPPPVTAAAVSTAPPAATGVTEQAPVTGEEQPPVEEARPEPLSFDPRARDFDFKPEITADSFIVVDADSGVVLLALREQRQRPIASLTKVMTSLLVIEDGELGRKVQVPEIATELEPNVEGLKAGRWYERRLLLYSTLLASANDSATTLGYAAGDGSLERFYRRMNERAAALGMLRTTYASASGLDDEQNRSSAFDQALLAREALGNRTLAKMVATARRTVVWPPPTYEKEWVNHNIMLETYRGAYGVKTGYTSAAGACLMFAAERDGHHLIGVALGSENIWRDMKRIMNEGFRRVG